MAARLLEGVRITLERARAQGVPFGDAWRSVLVGAGGYPDISSWWRVLNETAESWQRAYCGDPPTEAERALVALIELRGLEDADLVDLTFLRCCDWCGEPLPAGSDPQRRYCSTGHRRQANYARERERIADGRKHGSEGAVRVLPTVRDCGAHTDSAVERTAA